MTNEQYERLFRIAIMARRFGKLDAGLEARGYITIRKRGKTDGTRYVFITGAGVARLIDHLSTVERTL